MSATGRRSIVAIWAMHHSRISLASAPEAIPPMLPCATPVSGLGSRQPLYWQLDIPGQPKRREPANDPEPRVELMPFEAERSRIREGVVVVVPSLAPCQHAEPGGIAAAVARGGERTRA